MAKLAITNEQLSREIERRKQAEEFLKERLRFEELLSDLSAGFVNLSLDQIDSKIEYALKQIRDFFEVDRVGLVRPSQDKTAWQITHIASADDVLSLRVATDLPAGLLPWVYKEIVERGEVLSFARLDDLPAEASIDKQTYREWGIRSAVYIPIKIFGGSIEYFLAINANRRERTWPEEYIHRLRVLGETFVSSLERRENRLQLEERLRFEILLSEISARFVSLSAERIDREIEDAQRRVCECLGLDLSALWQWSVESPRLLTMTHLYRPLGGPPTPEPMRADEYFPWCMQQLEAGKIIALSSMEDLPAEAARDREVWRQFGVKTTLTIPLSAGGGPAFGALSFNTMQTERNWPEVIVKRLQLIAEIFANALARKRADHELRESEAHLSLATDAVDAGLWIMEADTGRVWISPKIRELFHFALNEEIYYENFFKVIHVEDREQVHQGVQRSLQSGETFRCDYRIVLPDGSIRWIGSRGRRFLKSTKEPKRLMGLSLDITERKLLELQLSESQTLLSALINSTSDLIWSVDSEHFGLLTFNRGLYEYFLHGIGLHIEVGMNPDDLLPTKEYAQKWYMFYRRALQEGSFTTEYQVYTGAMTLRLNLNTLKRDGIVFGVSVFGQDITESKRLENQLVERLQDIEALKQQLEKENIQLREEIKLQHGHEEIVGRSGAMNRVLNQVEQVAQTDSTVLIQGETGTGKELLARAIHQLSGRKDRPLVTVNCASLPPTLIESELFGRERGAYTGALTRMVGRFEAADGSTLFLDEIGELPPEIQSKLLRVLEEGRFERLGSSKTLQVNVRIIAATNRDLAQDVKDGKFRKDLYYRLNVFPITVPPLRERPEDIPHLVWSFVKQFEKKMGKLIDHIPTRSMQALQSYPWPGNVRELRNAIEHAMIVSSGSTLEVSIGGISPAEKIETSNLRDAERRCILEVLEKTCWRITGEGGAAAILGLKRTTLQSKMKKLGIKRPPP
jgi:formate hydrogenlyase transcriptional activator